jgi:hypothetical protein
MCDLQIWGLANDELEEIKGDSNFGCLFTYSLVEKGLKVTVAGEIRYV